MSRDGMKFVGMILKTSTKHRLRKDDALAQRVMQITVEVAGEGVDQVARDLLAFGPEEDLNIEVSSRQRDYIREQTPTSEAGQTFMDDLTKRPREEINP